MVCVIHRATQLGVCRNYHESCYPPPPPTKKKSKFSNQNQKFQTPKTPLIIPVTSNLVYPPWGWGIFLPYLQKLGQNHHFHVWEEPFPKQLFIFCASVRATQYYIVDIQGEILPYNNVVEHILAELAICKMAAFYYYDQNPFWFSLHIQIWLSQQGLNNKSLILHKDANSWRILVVVVKWHHIFALFSSIAVHSD